jgi:oligopeptide transport system permease protein
MAAFIIRRILGMLAVLLVVSFVTFFLLRFIPGGPFAMDQRQIPEEILDNLNARYHLDDPLWKQYADYVGSIAVPRITESGESRSALEDYLININLPFVSNRTFRWMNFGPSLRLRSRTVSSMIREDFPVSAELGLYALVIALSIGIPAGTMAALNRNSFYDYFGMSIAVVGVSLPVIILGPILQYVFGLQLNWLPIAGWGSPEHIVMPAFALGFSNSALVARLTRASLLQVLQEDYIRTAHAKGMTPRRVIVVHAMKNAFIPVVTILGPLTAFLVTGSFVAEMIFAIDGIGRAFIVSIGARDYPLVMGTVLLFAVILIIANTLVDVLYALIDPRIRLV